MATTRCVAFSLVRTTSSLTKRETQYNHLTFRAINSVATPHCVVSQWHTQTRKHQNQQQWRRSVHLPTRTTLLQSMQDGTEMEGTSTGSAEKQRISVTGTIYESDRDGDPVVQLFTKEGCTLCDKVKEVLIMVREEEPHTLEAVDITDGDKTDWFAKYKYDIPILRINGQYWTKHRLSEETALSGLNMARSGSLSSSSNSIGPIIQGDIEPDASKYEH
eukprot:scaffold64230_cov41-Attheya_sp.AAC.3